MPKQFHYKIFYHLKQLRNIKYALKSTDIKIITLGIFILCWNYTIEFVLTSEKSILM